MHEGPRRKAGQGAPGPLELLHTWERPRPGRPRGAGGGLALGPWRRGGPGLAQRRRLQEARGFGLRRRRLLVLDRSAGPAPFGNPPPSGPPPPRPRPRLRPRPAPGARSKLSDMLLALHRGPPPLLRIGRAGGAAGRLSPLRLTQASWRRPAGPARSSALRAPADAPQHSARLPGSLRLTDALP